MIVAFVAFFQYVTEVIIGYNYALGQVTVTPMALLMTYLACSRLQLRPRCRSNACSIRCWEPYSALCSR